MSWNALGTQFCLELAFGVLFALAFVPRAPVGVLFYRVMGTAALVPVLVAIAGSVLLEGSSWLDPIVLSAGLAVAAFPIYSGPVRGRPWAAALALAGLGVAVALVLTLARAADVAGGWGMVLASVSALATGTVAGSVGLAMVLGHWYLTVPNLQVRHLRRLNLLTVGAMVASLALIGSTCAVFARELDDAATPLFGSWGLFHLGTRVAVGLLLPLVFAWMAASSLRFDNTRSATGILYASTVLVLIGTAVSISLQDSYGVPL